MLPMNFPGRKKVRREEAVARQAERNNLSPSEQIARLDRLGMAAVKERARLRDTIAAIDRKAQEKAEKDAHEEQIRATKKAAKEAARKG